MIRNMVAFILFAVSTAIFAGERALDNQEFSDLNCSQEIFNKCKGRRATETQRGIIPRLPSRTWEFHDPFINTDNEYDALRAYICPVMRPSGTYFSDILIAKLEIHPRNTCSIRTITTFLSQLINFQGGSKIYAWVKLKKNELDPDIPRLLKTHYCFSQSSDSLLTPDTQLKVFCPYQNIVQLVATREDIKQELDKQVKKR